MAKDKVTVARNSVELAKTLGLKPSDAYEWEVQAVLLSRLKSIIESARLTHAEVAKKARTSRTRVTAILNGNLDHVSTDLLIRILGSLGYVVNVSISRVKIAT